jgi:hypothetical protein
MSFKAQSSLRNCLTCDFWTGSRKIDVSRYYAETGSATDKGECAGGGMNHVQVPAAGNCGQWSKWGPMK